MTAPPPSLSSQSTRAASGCCSVSHWAPSAPPVSSSTTEMTFSSPRGGRQPWRARCAAATTSAAVCDFMSTAPRPHSAPSWTSPDHGSWLPVGGVREHGVDVREVAEDRAVGLAAQAGDRFGRSGAVGASSSHSEPGVLEVGLQPLLARALVPGRVDRVEPDEPGEDVGRLGLEVHQADGRAVRAAARPRARSRARPAPPPPSASSGGRPQREQRRRRAPSTAELPRPRRAPPQQRHRRAEDRADRGRAGAVEERARGRGRAQPVEALAAEQDRTGTTARTRSRRRAARRRGPAAA